MLRDLQALLVLQKLKAFLSWMIGWIDSYIDVADDQDLWPDESPQVEKATCQRPREYSSNLGVFFLLCMSMKQADFARCRGYGRSSGVISCKCINQAVDRGRAPTSASSRAQANQWEICTYRQAGGDGAVWRIAGARIHRKSRAPAVRS